MDVLFALAIGAALEPLKAYKDLPVAAWSHLALAGVTIMLSWIGYRNSRARSTYRIEFPVNWPLIQFGIDVILVVTYWVLVQSAEPPQSRSIPSYKADLVLVTLAFVLYFAWDLVGLAMRRAGGGTLYSGLGSDVPARRGTTIVFALVLVIVTPLLLLGPQSHETSTVVAVDLALMVWLILYRVVKSGFPTAEATSASA